MAFSETPNPVVVASMQDALEGAYRGTPYAVERVADGIVLTVDPAALSTAASALVAGAAPLTTGQHRVFRLHVAADPATRTYRLRVTTRGVEWHLPGVSSNSVRLVQSPGRMRITASLSGTTFAGGTGEQRFTYDTDTDAARIEAALAPWGWARAVSSFRLGRFLALVGIGVVVVLGVVFGVLLATGAL